jgi:predicted metal-dependent phosphoesterase TrpH
MGAIDLHCHTNRSDGTLSPTDLVLLAESLGLSAIAVTDHDTIDGVEEAVDAGMRLRIEVIPGAELSIEYDLPENGHMHIVGLFLDTSCTKLREGLDWLRRKREERTPRILGILNEHGVHITEEEVMEKAGGASVGRPHMARLMVEKGYVDSLQEAFDRYLKKGAVAYAPKEKFPLEKALSMILAAGGLPILAHPYSLKLDDAALEELLITMKGMGLAGIEAQYSNHDQEHTSLYADLAGKLDLIVSGGSDFHGENKPDIRLGTGKGNLDIPYGVLEQMKRRRKDSKGEC